MPVITINVNRLDDSVKRQRLSDWIKKTPTSNELLGLQEACLKSDIKSKRMKNYVLGLF